MLRIVTIEMHDFENRSFALVSLFCFGFWKSFVRQRVAKVWCLNIHMIFFISISFHYAFLWLSRWVDLLLFVFTADCFVDVAEFYAWINEMLTFPLGWLQSFSCLFTVQVGTLQLFLCCTATGRGVFVQ